MGGIDIQPGLGDNSLMSGNSRAGRRLDEFDPEHARERA
jgi:hypothetical protein